MRTREGYHSEQVRNEAFEEVSKQLATLQHDVYAVICDHEPVTNEEIAEKLDKFPHEVCPRVLELRKLDLVEFAGKKIGKSGRKASLWKLKRAQTTLTFN
jgi:predicted ArsR family transcriptional regulator